MAFEARRAESGDGMKPTPRSGPKKKKTRQTKTKKGMGKEKEPPKKRAREGNKSESTKGEEILANQEAQVKARKVEIFPDSEQRRKIDRWLEVARWTYNQGVWATKERLIPMQISKLRAAFVNENGLALHRWLWATEVPYEIRDGAMMDLVKANKACRAKNMLRKQRGEDPVAFDFRFRCKKDRRQSVVMLKKNWNVPRSAFFANVFTPLMKSSEGSLPSSLFHDGRLVRERKGNRYRYYYILNVPLESRGENQAPSDRAVCAVDPGVRCFATIYDPHRHSVVNWGDGDMQRIYALSNQVDKLQSRWSAPGVRHRQRARLKNRASLLRSRIRSVVDETHKKLCTYLCSNYAVVLIPEFAVKHMVSRKHRKISTKTARAMCTWGHYRFRQRLCHKAREYPSCRIVVCDEPYTSMTCGACGVLNDKLGGAKVFRCPNASCRCILDRDANGARNIMLRYLSLVE